MSSAPKTHFDCFIIAYDADVSDATSAVNALADLYDIIIIHAVDVICTYKTLMLILLMN